MIGILTILLWVIHDNFVTLLWFIYMFVTNSYITVEIVTLYNSQIRIPYQHKICKFVKLCYQQFIYKYLYYFLNIQERSGNQQVQVQNFNFGPCLMFVELLDSNFNKKYGKIQKWTDKLQNVLLCYCKIKNETNLLLQSKWDWSSNPIEILKGFLSLTSALLETQYCGFTSQFEELDRNLQ